MRRFARNALYGTLCTAAAGLAAAQEAHDYAALAEAGQWEFLEQYCTECHNFEDYSGGIDFTGMGVEQVPQDAEIWEKAVRKLRGRMMPPPGQKKPDEERTDAFVAWLESYLDEAGTEVLDPHAKPIHRLNRKEYANAIRDLFGLEIEPASILPADNTLDGFDNIAQALQVSPAFIDQYVSAARSIVEQAVGDKSPGLGSTIYTPPEVIPNRALGGGRQQFHIEGLPLGTRGGMLVEHWFPADGEYSVSVGDWDLSVWLYNTEFENTMIFTVDGEKIHEVTLGGGEDLKQLDLHQAKPMEDINARTKNVRFSTTAGPHKIGVTFVHRSFAESDDRLEHFIPDALQDRVLSVPSVEIRGPFDPAGISETPTRQKIFADCYPASPAEEQACAERVITRFATRAYRRPVTAEDLSPLLAFYERGAQAGGFEEGVRQALTRMLSSPNFLYRIELTPPDTEPGSIYELPGVELASRLSFFLWSSIPDEELLELAVNDELQKPEVLEAQVRRMLADARSSSLAANFAYQWLDLAKLDEIAPDADLFPYASGPGDLRGDFKKEMELFIDSVFRADRNVLDLLRADHSFLNERLALHYGIKNVKGNKFRRVELEDPLRFGLLGKGGILMASSYPNRTSPVLRGAYILDNILGTPPSPPPPNVEDLQENEVGQPAVTVRERLEQHRENPSCNGCHGALDPLGFALENFDAVGRYRVRDRWTGTQIDASATLPSGRPIDGPLELRQAILDRPGMFVQTLTENLMTYALGRPVEAHDMPTVRAIVDKAAEDDYRFSSIVMNIINSHQFRMKKAPEADGIGGSGVALSD